MIVNSKQRTTMQTANTTTETAGRDTNLAVHFSSKTDLWATPQDFFDALDAEFGFTLDVCALPENAKCERYFTPKEDGLHQSWQGVCWMNPPYGREIGKWVRKAFESAKAGATVVCLLPARTDTAWWHTWAMKAEEVRFVRGRLKFGTSKNSAPFPSAVVIFRPSRNVEHEPCREGE
jgi:phage N-6-adenine-methyltransferase